ncbi:hypothetical protein E2320_020880, partial [Naja naja]
NLAVANLPASMASETTIVIPSNGANIIQTALDCPVLLFRHLEQFHILSMELSNSGFPPVLLSKSHKGILWRDSSRLSPKCLGIFTMKPGLESTSALQA